MKQLLLCLIVTLIVSDTFGQRSLTPRQQRLDKKIQKKINKRYADSLYYEIGYDKERERVLIFRPIAMRDTIDSLMRVIRILRESSKADSLVLYKDSTKFLREWGEGTNSKYQTLQSRISEIRNSYDTAILRRDSIIKSRDSLIKILNSSAGRNPAQIRELNSQISGLEAQISQLNTKGKEYKFKIDSMTRHQAGLIDTARLKFVIDSTDNIIKNLSNLLKQHADSSRYSIVKVAGLTTYNGLAMAILLSLFIAGVTALLLYQKWKLGVRRRKIKFLPCMVIDIQGKFVIAEVLDIENLEIEIRRFEIGPLEGIINIDGFAEDLFEVGIFTKTGKKEFIFRKANNKYRETFKEIHEKAMEILDQSTKD